jgi:hypothetical protein
MKTQCLSFAFGLFFLTIFSGFAQDEARPGRKMPWDRGRLSVSENGRFLQHADGSPFFWLGETAWLFPSRLSRDEAGY